MINRVKIDEPIHMVGPVLSQFIQLLREHPDYIDCPNRVMLDELVVEFDEYTRLDFNDSNTYHTLSRKGRKYWNEFVQNKQIVLYVS